MKLTAQDIETLLAELPHWAYQPERGGLLKREFQFRDFAQAFGFMSQVALHAERANHHPEWFNVYHRVSVTLTTHDAGGVTNQDIEMARLMDRIASALATQATT